MFNVYLFFTRSSYFLGWPSVHNREIRELEKLFKISETTHHCTYGGLHRLPGVTCKLSTRCHYVCDRLSAAVCVQYLIGMLNICVSITQTTIETVNSSLNLILTSNTVVKAQS